MHLQRSWQWLEERQWIATTILAILAAAVIVVQPMYHDHAIYWRGGELIADGKKLADDYLVKQPLIYVFFACAKLLFGEHEWSYRLLDAGYQIATAAGLALFASRLYGNATVAALSATLYLLLYSANAFVLGAHPESLAGLPLLLIAVGRLHSDNTPMQRVGEGVLLAVLLWLKITFAVVAVALISLDVMHNRQSVGARAIGWLMTLASAVLVSFAGIALLADRIEWSSLPDVAEYLRFYGSLPPLDKAAVNAWHNLIRFTGENLTFSATALAGAGIGILARSSYRHTAVWSAFTLAMVLSVVIERKFGVVHLWRLLPWLALPVSLGCIAAVRALRNTWNAAKPAIRATMIVPLVVVGLALSPLPRFAKSLALPVYALTSTDRYNAAFQRHAHNILHRQTLWQIAGYIASNRSSSDRVFVLSSCMSQLYVFLHEPHWHHFSTTMPIFAAHVPQHWRNLYRQDLRRADWLVVSTLDHAATLFGHDRSSWESLQADSSSAAYVRSHFECAMETPIAYVFKRTVPDVSPYAPSTR